MARYIDADALAVQIRDNVFHDFTDEFWGVMQCIGDSPTEDVVPVVHAHWERHFKRQGVYEDLWLYCTNCNSRTSEEYAPYWWLYCPHCGARMDEEVV